MKITPSPHIPTSRDIKASLHMNNILHRDLKPSNVLFTSEGFVKIGDFGSARMSQADITTTKGGKTPLYNAPELNEGAEASEATDVYALALTLYEVLAGRPAFDPSLPPRKLMNAIDSRSRPTVPSFARPELVRVIKSCWDRDPKKRMTMSQIVEAFSSVDWMLVDGADPKAIVLLLAKFPPAGQAMIEPEIAVVHVPDEDPPILEPGEVVMVDGTASVIDAVNGEWTKSHSALAGDPSNVKSIVFPPGVKSIGDDALRGYHALTSVVIPELCTKIGSYAFSGTNLADVTIPANCVSIGSNAFFNCRALKSVTIPATCTQFGERVFQSCTTLTSVAFPPECASIPAWICDAGISLTGVTIPASCTSIGERAFGWCWALKDVTVPAGCSTQADAFKNSPAARS